MANLYFTRFIMGMEVSFKAKYIAATKNTYKKAATKIDLYELTPKDRPFLEHLQNDIDFGGLNMCEFEQKRWAKVLNYGIENAKCKDYKSYLAMHSNKPCGLLTAQENGSSLYLDCICDIPQKGKRVNYTGSTLFLQLFKLAEELKSKTVDLFAVIDGPIDVVSKYKSKGFKVNGTDGNYFKMSCNKYNIKEQINELSGEIEYKPIKNHHDIDLNTL